MGKIIKILILGAAAVVVAAGAVIVFRLLFCFEKGPDIAIAGREITKEEYIQCMNGQKYHTAIRLQQEYGVDSSNGSFWLKEIDGKVFYKELADDTVEELRYIHAVYEIAVECGNVEDARYESLISRMEEENERRRETIESGGVIYGLAEYTPELYMNYEMSSLKDMYCADETNEGMDLTNEEIQEYYDSKEWVVGHEAEMADLDSVRTAVEAELRDKKYEEMVEKRAAELEVTGDMERMYRFVRNRLKE